ncbi:Argonaute complex, subunit Arb1 [Terfezia claveryi]|nr:Argonaute complex, subunit Arb1 [Terfezia claveryi]
MELCIQRYRAKRRWDPIRLKLFDRYLVLGGIRTGQKAYGGGLSLEARGEGAEEPDAADIAAQTATDFVENYTTSARNQNDWTGAPGVFEDDEEWWVDFEYVVKVFLSHVIQQVFCLHTEEDLLLGIKTIRNFLNYVVFHNVAPEYSSNIFKAISICTLAEKELLFCNAANGKLPGLFNTCCSALFGGHYLNLYEDDQATTWEGKSSSNHPSLGIPRDIAQRHYLECIAKIGTPEQIAADVEGVKLVRQDAIAFEVLSIDLPKSGAGGSRELGSLYAKAWVYEGERMPKHGLPEEGWKLWVEKDIGIYLFVGVKVQAVVYTLSNGLFYLDTVTALSPSYYTYLEPPNQSDINDDADGEDAEGCSALT